jgi:hypothetical protein
MKTVAIGFALSVGIFVAGAANAEDCSTVLRFDETKFENSNNYDWRMAESLTRDQWSEISHHANADAIVYGVPLGASWQDYHANAEHLDTAHQEQLSVQQNTALWMKTMSDNSVAAYRECIRNVGNTDPGLHLSPTAYTDDKEYLLLSYTPTRWTDPHVVSVTWQGSAVQGARLQTRFGPEQPIEINRGDVPKILIVTLVDGKSLPPITIPAKVVPIPPLRGYCQANDVAGSCLRCGAKFDYRWTAVTHNGDGQTSFKCPDLKTGGIVTARVDAKADSIQNSGQEYIETQFTDPKNVPAGFASPYFRGPSQRWPVQQMRLETNTKDIQDITTAQWTLSLHDCITDLGPNSTCYMIGGWAICSSGVVCEPW